MEENLPLFAYGTLCDTEEPKSDLLVDFEIGQIPARGFPGIRPAAGAAVRGQLIADPEYPLLDFYESVESGLYRRVRVRIHRRDGQVVEAWTYEFLQDWKYGFDPIPSGNWQPTRREG